MCLCEIWEEWSSEGGFIGCLVREGVWGARWFLKVPFLHHVYCLPNILLGDAGKHGGVETLVQNACATLNIAEFQNNM